MMIMKTVEFLSIKFEKKKLIILDISKFYQTIFKPLENPIYFHLLPN